MSRIIRLVLALVVLTCSSPTTEIAALTVPAGNGVSPPFTANAGDEQSEAIRAVLTKQQSAWNRGDIPAFLQGYWDSPKLTFSGRDGIVRGYDGLLARYRKSYPDAAAMGELEFSGLEIRTLAPDAALVLGHWHLRRQMGDTGGVFTLVFRKFSMGWRIIHDHTSAQK